MIERLHHIGIAVEDLEEAVRLYRDVIGLSFEGIEEVPSERVRVAIFKVGDTHYPCPPDADGGNVSIAHQASCGLAVDGQLLGDTRRAAKFVFHDMVIISKKRE